MDLVADSVLGESQLGGPPPMSTQAPADTPTTPLETQMNREHGTPAGNRDEGRPDQQQQDAATLNPPDSGGDTSSDTSTDDAKLAAFVQPEGAQPQQPKAGASKGPSLPDWASVVGSAIQQAPARFANPFLGVDWSQLDPATLYYHALGVSRAWNALTADENAMRASASDVWNDQSVKGKVNQSVLAGMFGAAGLTAQTTGVGAPALRWLTENALPMALTAGADFSMPTFLLSMAGNLPDNPKDAPMALLNATPGPVIASAISDPKQLTTPEGASRLFWKYLTSALSTASVLPVVHSAVRPFLSPEALRMVDDALVQAKINVPHDVRELPDVSDLVPEATQIPNVVSRSVVAPAAGELANVGATINRETGEVQVNARSLAQSERAMLNRLGLDNWGELAGKAQQLSDEQVQALKQNWSQFMPYDLVRQMPEDRVATDPMSHIDEVAPEARDAYRNMVAATTTTLAHVRSGPFAQEANAIDSVIHSLLPQHRTTDWLMKQAFLPAVGKLAAAAKLNGEDITRALRDPEAYDALPAEGKGVVDSWDLISRTVRDERAKVNFPVGAVPSFDPRVPRSVEDQVGKLSKQVQKAIGLRDARGGTGPLTTGNRQHRAEALMPDPENPERVVLSEKHPDVFSINAAQSDRQMQIVDDLLNQGVPMEQAVARAAAQAPLYHTDFFRAMAQELPQAIHSLHSYQAADMLSNSIMPNGMKLAYRKGEGGAEQAMKAGYKAINSKTGAYENMLWHPAFADKINDLNSRPLEGPGVAKTAGRLLDKVNNISRAVTMLPPMVHGENLLGRAVDLTFTHPTSTLDQVLGKRGAEADMVRNLMRQLEAYKAGVVPYLPHNLSVDNLYGELGRVTGDGEHFEPPGVRDTQGASPSLVTAAKGIGRAVGGGYQYAQNKLWQGAANFAVDAYHIEKAALDHKYPDMDEAAKQRYAANRANEWQGRLGPENWTKASYVASRLLFFAPNWQRTFYELMAPTYNARAIAAAPQLRGYMLANNLRTIRGMALAQFFTGNAMNMLLSGHPQWENDPGNSHKIEVTRPEILRAMQAAGQLKDFDPNTGRRKSDGAVVTLEDPWARQQLQALRPTGFDDISTSSGTSASDTPFEGAAKTVAGQLAPAWAIMAGAMNIDLFRSIYDHQLRTLNPNEPVGPHADNIMPTLLRAFNTAGLGDSTAQRVTQANAQSNVAQARAQQQIPDWVKSTGLPLGAQEMIANGPHDALAAAFSALSGVAAPYLKAPKTEGDPLSDSQLAMKNQLQDQYDSRMTDLSQQLTSGRITPQQWLQGYQNAHGPYSDGMRNLYHDAPEYMDGQLGLVNEYLKIDNDPSVHDPVTGALDYAKLSAKQEEFKAKLTPQQATDLSAGLQRNNQQYPALGMYRAVQDAHDRAIGQWAQQIGVPPATLRASIQKYGSLSGPAAAQYRATHPEVAQYESLNKQWEMNTYPGRMYSLYYMTPTAQRWLMAQYGSTGAQAQEQAATQIEKVYQSSATS